MTSFADPTITAAPEVQPEQRRRRWLLWLVPAATTICISALVLAALFQPKPPERFLGIGDITMGDRGSEPMWWLDPVIIEPGLTPEPAVEVLAPSDGLFASGSHQIDPTSRSAIADTIAAAINDSTVTGGHVRCHTDDVGTDQENKDLSDRRATSIVTLLTELGIEPAVVVTEGLGEAEPAHDNTTATGRALNRRCEIRLELAP